MGLSITSKNELEKAENLYGDKQKYYRLLKTYLFWAKMNLVQKHSTHDSLFFIFKEIEGFKIVKFYEGGVDYRVSGHLETLSDAYNEGCHGL